MLILNDTHLGFRRVGGTTQSSQVWLTHYLQNEFKRVLDETDDEQVVILGDLFDDFEISNYDLSFTINTLRACVLERGRHLTLVAGNHDINPRGDKMSSFSLLAEILVATREIVNVVDINEVKEIAEGVIAVAHHSNQDLFDAALDKAYNKVEEGDFVLLHANYNNHFAAQSDHSLNVSEEAARRFIDKGVSLVFAHEHQARREMPVGAKQTGAEVIVLGNQIPTSISDCLGNDTKFSHRLVEDLERIQVWSADDPAHGFKQLDWRDLSEHVEFGGFIRVTGDAKASEASAVIDTIARFRQKSAAFVVSNAVKVEGMVEAESLPEQFDEARKFDVLEFIRGHLGADEYKVVEGLLTMETQT